MSHKRAWLPFCLLFIVCRAFAAERDFASVDARIRALPKASSIAEAASSIAEAASPIAETASSIAEAASSIAETASSIGKGSQGQWEKVRGLYIWMTENIAYDADAYFKGTKVSVDAEGVFRSGKSVCQGYAGLMAELGKRLGLEVAVVSGYAKGYGYGAGQRFSAPNHAWNAIKVDGQWRLFDSTWGAGHVDGSKFVKRYSELWFDTPPALFIYHHLPSEASWSLTPRPMTLGEFESQAFVELYALESLRALGFPDDSILRAIASGGLPKSWSYPGYSVRAVSAPIQATLAVGESYAVELESADLEKVFAVSGGKWTPFEREGTTFRAKFKAAAGETWIAGFLSFQGKESYWPFLIYEGK